MRLLYIAVVAILASTNVYPAAADAEVSSFTFTERPHWDRSLTAATEGDNDETSHSAPPAHTRLQKKMMKAIPLAQGLCSRISLVKALSLKLTILSVSKTAELKTLMIPNTNKHWKKDVNEVEPPSKEGKQTRQSWSRVLIESGLSKQQAFGILEDVDDGPEGGSLAAKIALKMARIRQLDTILEEKLGKNLYANIVPKKQKKVPTANMTGSRTFVTQTPAATSHCNEYTMSSAEKQAIEELIAAKSGVYPLFAIDELQDGPTEVACQSSSKDSSRHFKDNIIQETKRERLLRQRLSRVEQELRFLQESPSVVIVGDDRDEDESGDCRSELSYVTAVSSTCSTRSGVISRHDFKCFLAQQKESFSSTPTASVDEIRRLLLSINHGAPTATS
eukprot:jgi/Phyca11/534894/estExt2_fgenesh1_pg.C_PHYCAscaffold_290059